MAAHYGPMPKDYLGLTMALAAATASTFRRKDPNEFAIM